MDEEKMRNNIVSPTRFSWPWWISLGKFLMIMLGVMFLGLLVVNQSLEYHYRSAFLQTPCELCADLNPGVDRCVHPERYDVPVRVLDVRVDSLNLSSGLLV